MVQAEQTFGGRKHCAMGEKTEKFKASVVRDEPGRWVWPRVSRRAAQGEQQTRRSPGKSRAKYLGGRDVKERASAYRDLCGAKTLPQAPAL